jgi:phosphohistidine phosphatase SixA
MESSADRRACCLVEACNSTWNRRSRGVHHRRLQHTTKPLRSGARSGRSHWRSLPQTARVFSSQWCRCRETAELLELGPVNELPALNSFYQRPENRKPQTEALREWLEKQDLSSVHVLVTHQVNITALTGVFPSSGELVIVRAPGNGDITVIGTIEAD